MGAKKEIAASRYMFAMGRRMEERQLSGAETLKDVMVAAEFEEEMVNMPVPDFILKGKKPRIPIDPRTRKPKTYSEPKMEKYGPKYKEYPKEEMEMPREEKPPPKKK